MSEILDQVAIVSAAEYERDLPELERELDRAERKLDEFWRRWDAHDAEFQRELQRAGMRFAKVPAKLWAERRGLQESIEGIEYRRDLSLFALGRLQVKPLSPEERRAKERAE